MAIATDADPVTGSPLISAADGRRHRELYRGVRSPDGRFAWTPLTADSTVDNLRPVWAASASGATALMWLRGRYTTFLDFSMSLVGIVHRADGSVVGPSGVVAPAASGQAHLVPGNFDTAATGDLLMYRSGPARRSSACSTTGATSRRHRSRLRPTSAGLSPVISPATSRLTSTGTPRPDLGDFLAPVQQRVPGLNSDAGAGHLRSAGR